MKTLFLDDQQEQLLREILESQPLTPRYLPFVADLMSRLEPTAAQEPGGGSTRPAPPVPESGRGFQLIAHTWEGAALKRMLDRVLPHGDGL